MGIKTLIKEKKWGKIRFWSLLVAFVFFVIVWAAQYFLTRTADVALKDSSKYIAVVMSGADKTFTIPKEFKDGFGEKTSFKATDNNQTIYIDKKEDLYSIEQAKTVAENLIADDKYVLIIGNSNSQLSEVTLNAILDSPDRPAFIMPIATSDNIISKAKSEDYKAILRMVPDNNNQAAIITRLIFKEFPEKPQVAILVDEENATYSTNLSKNIAAKVMNENGNIVFNEKYGNSNRLINIYDLLENHEMLPDIIVYVGISSNGVLLIEELNAMKIDIPVVFTDGCTVNDLIKKAKDLPGETFFLSAVEKSDNGLEPTYEPIGKDAFTLSARIMERIQGEITRESVRDFIRNNKNELKIDGGFAGSYEFTDDGNNKAMNFKIYYFNNKVLTKYGGIE